MERLVIPDFFCARSRREPCTELYALLFSAPVCTYTYTASSGSGSRRVFERRERGRRRFWCCWTWAERGRRLFSSAGSENRRVTTSGLCAPGAACRVATINFYPPRPPTASFVHGIFGARGQLFGACFLRGGLRELAHGAGCCVQGQFEQAP
ncbi:hypothetical protein C8F04DRAFT_63697 [Mycena alexandri]|uniref:Uncharacterized protein n=1 Tax=Mycena alexandri TaxID=1745969 RepID=A0AAD6SJ51_9AGAR|nr:hypothetical protein C8F04DRAFT_63697 [Mycena alexandri]